MSSTIEDIVEPEISDDSDFYFGQIDDEARAFLSRPRRRPTRCVWCWLADGKHTPECDEMRSTWSLRMPWGKFKGTPVSDVDRGYLTWLWGKRATLESEFRAEIARVLNVRDQVGDTFLN